MLHVHIYWYVFVQTVYVRKGVGRSFTDGSDSTPMMQECSPSTVHMYNCFISSSRCAVKLYSPTCMYVFIALCIRL